ncbi:MAG: RnfABCDGE type electron transport complex subunit D [Proteobacteria bacterium]|nr:RnfABCDGE type electron transport complex subunit D [Pseudomonadota bacterium]MBU1610743.1 RnfABCDGE type electron transport complex subunit D [Pseudomonadota bacterium]
MIRPPKTLFTVSCPPHIHCGRTFNGLMLETILALMPAALLAVVTYGFPALRVMALSCSVAVLVEAACWKVMGRPQEVDNFNALLLGLIFSFLLPATAPWWLVTVGSAITIVLGKAIFGGLGGSPLNAALLSWASLHLSWPESMDIELNMLGSSFADPLAQLKHFGVEAVANIPLTDLLLGKQVAGLGVSHILALLVGGLYLLLRGRIRWHMPVSFLTGVLATATLFFLVEPGMHPSPLFHLATGTVIFGAFFLITDPSSSPVGRIPMLAFGFLAGALVMVVRVWGTHPDGVAFAILLANLLTPMLEKLRPKPFGLNISGDNHA